MLVVGELVRRKHIVAFMVSLWTSRYCKNLKFKIQLQVTEKAEMEQAKKMNDNNRQVTAEHCKHMDIQAPCFCLGIQSQ